MKDYQFKEYKFLAAGIFCLCCLLYGSAFSISAQSTDQNYPTPITSNEISGKISARDIGDARLTSYFYTFDGAQGDVFINVVTNNFNGDIDVFTADNLRPLTKITIYADDADSETGRVVYLRQPLKLILRIEGRSPNDDAATFRIKFAGSFTASKANVETAEPKTPEVKTNEETGIRVNSVGTIIAVKPKPTPTPKAITVEKKADKPATTARIEKPAKVKNANKNQTEKSSDSNIAETSAVKPEEKQVENPTIITIDKNPSPTEAKTSNEVETESSESKPTESRPTVLVTDDIAEKKTETTKIEIRKDSPESAETIVENNPEKATTGEKKPPVKAKKKNSPEPVPSAALENIRLVILFKDGTKIERPMSEILKFGVDRGILTVISKDGSIGRYSILDIEKTTIQ